MPDKMIVIRQMVKKIAVEAYMPPADGRTKKFGCTQIPKRTKSIPAYKKR